MLAGDVGTKSPLLFPGGRRATLDVDELKHAGRCSPAHGHLGRCRGGPAGCRRREVVTEGLLWSRRERRLGRLSGPSRLLCDRLLMEQE